MGGKHSTSTSTVSIPKEVLARYNAVNARAETAASKPWTSYGNTASDYVAQMNAQQNAGINDINATAGSYQPYMTQATQATQAGMGPAYAGIENYMSPYIKNVADTTGAYMRQQQEQAQSGALGTAAMSGAFGGDRAGIAAANLQQQNQMGYGKTMADIMNQGYTQALGASQADLARQLQGGAQMAQLGSQSQQLGLQGAQAKIAAGTMQQQTEQAGKDAMIQRFMQEQGYPFQTAQFLANIAMGTGAAQGSTTTTQTPRSVFGFAQGGGVAGPRTYSQGTIGGEGYVPVGDLPIGQLMVAQPPQQSQDDKTGQILQLIASTMGAKHGGAIDQRHGYATDGFVSYPAINTEELRRALLTKIVNPQTKNAIMQAPTNPANMGLAGHQSLPSPTTGVAPASEVNLAEVNQGANEVLRDWNAEQFGMGHPDTVARYSLPITTGVASAPSDDAAHRAVMAKALGAREPRASERYMVPTGLNPAADYEAAHRAIASQAYGDQNLDTAAKYTMPTGLGTPALTATPLSSGPSFENVGRSNSGSLMDQANTAAEVSGGVAPPAVLATPVPTPKEYAIGNDIYLKQPNGFITYANGDRINPDMAESIRNEIDRQDRVTGDARLMQGEEMVQQFRQATEDRAQRNKDALLGMYQGEFPVPAYTMPRYQIPTSLGSPTAFGLPPGPPPTGGVSAPAMASSPGGVQQPMAFTAGLGTPPSSDLAPATSPRPRARPDLGTPAAAVTKVNGTPVTLSSAVASPVEQNGVAGPEQTGIYTGVAGAGAGWVDLTRPDGSVEHRTGARNWRNNNPGNIEYGKLAKQYGAIGTDGRFAIFPDAASGQNAMKGLLFDSGAYQGMTIASALNKYSPPSENDTAGKIQAVVAETGLDPNTPLDQMTPQQRDAFTLAIQHTEGPMKGDVGASSPYTTSQVGGLGNADMAQQRDGLFSSNKPYENRNMIGKFFHDPTTGKLNPNAVMALLSGIGHAAEAQTISPIGALLSGIGAGSDTYKQLQKQQADIGLTNAQAYRENVGADVGRFFTWGNIPMVSLGNGRSVKISEYLANPGTYSTGNQQQDAAILREAQTRASTEESAPVNTRWTNASNDAISAAKAYEASDAGAINFTGNNEAVQNLTLQANEAMNSAIAAKPTVNELAYTVGSSIADGTMGSAQGRNSVLQNVLAPLNAILRSAGINMDTLDDTQTQAQLMQKIGSLNAESLTPEQQRAASVFQQFVNVSPNMEMTPDAAAAITSSLMLSNQYDIDTANYYNRFQQEAGMGFAPQQMSSGYANEYGQLHQIEKNNLTNLFTAAQDKTIIGNSGMTRGQYVKNFLDQANGGGLSQDQAQAILNYILGPENTSQALARYFIKGM
jgi:hypothetical protein